MAKRSKMTVADVRNMLNEQNDQETVAGNKPDADTTPNPKVQRALENTIQTNTAPPAGNVEDDSGGDKVGGGMKNDNPDLEEAAEDAGTDDEAEEPEPVTVTTETNSGKTVTSTRPAATRTRKKATNG